MKNQIAHQLPESGRGRKRHASLRAFLAWLVCGWLTCAAWPARGATYVISTDDVPLSTGVLTAIGAGQGTSTPGWFFISPSRAGSLNGTPVRFWGYIDSAPTAVFVVGGNLNLSPGDRILGIGAYFLKLEVAGDANIPAGASISVEGRYLVPGAGGGAGGVGGVYPQEIPLSLRLPGFTNEGFKFPPPTRGGSGDGINGIGSLYSTYQNVYYLNPAIPGTSGRAGKPGYRTSTLMRVDGAKGGVSLRNINASFPARVEGGAGGHHHSSVDPVEARGGAGGRLGTNGWSQGRVGFGASYFTDGENGGDGGPGENGADGIDGPSGTNALVPISLLGGTLLDGGAGGGGGASGSWGWGGGQGGGGGGGGYGGASYTVIGQAFQDRILFWYQKNWGGDGGVGQPGEDGGRPGNGGHGGGGGGGLELVVRGVLNLAGTISARGGDGGPGGQGQAGTTSEAVAYFEHGLGASTNSGAGTMVWGCGHGGRGGWGGQGGKGGHGGNGGNGGAGSGGIVHVVAYKFVVTGGGGINVSGGTSPDGSGNAVNGIARWLSEVDGMQSPSTFVRTVSRANPYNSFTPVGLDLTEGRTPLITSDVKLVGGPDVYGLLSAGNLGLAPDTNNAWSSRSLPDRPPNAVALVQRLNSILGNPSPPKLVFSSVSDSNIKDPALANNRPGDTMKVTPQPVQVRGFASEWPFAVPTTSGAQRFQLPPYQTWLTYIRPGSSIISGSFSPYNNPAPFSMSTMGILADEHMWLRDTGLLRVKASPSLASSFQVGLNDVISDRQTNELPVRTYARVGPGTPIRFEIMNAGRAGSLMSSLPGSDVVFSNLPANGSIPVYMTVGATPNLGVPPPGTVPATMKVVTDAGTVNVAATVTTVGPKLNAFVTGNTDPIFPGQSRPITFKAQNVAGPSAGGPYGLEVPKSNFVLNILSMEIVGLDSNYFTLEGPTNGEVPVRFTSSGTNDVHWTNRIIFNPTIVRTYTAKLRIRTDAKAPPGIPGEIYEMDLSTTAQAPTINITQQPAGLSIPAGGTANFQISAQALGTSDPITYQWSRNGEPIFGATSSTYVTGPQTSPAIFRCTLSAGALVALSQPAYLTLIETSSPYAAEVMADQPLVYYRFRETGGLFAYDSSGFNNHGEYYNVLHVNGPSTDFGLSAGFADASEFLVPELVNPATGNHYFDRLTFEAWVKLDPWPEMSEGASLFAVDASPTGAFQAAAINPGAFAMRVQGSRSLLGTNDEYVLSNPAVFTTNVWLHVVTVYDRDTRRLDMYTNGALAMTVQLLQAPPVFMTWASIGEWYIDIEELLQRKLHGQIDEVAIYAKTLGSGRIATHYNAAASLTITQQPADAWASPGGTANFSVVAKTFAISGPLTYQWEKDGAPIFGATSDTYTTEPLTLADNGALYRCAVSAGALTSMTDAAVLTVVNTNAPYPQAVLADAPLLYYRLEEQSGRTAFDSSGNGYHGTSSNLVAAPAPAPWLGSSASFGGASAQASVAVPSLVNPETSNSFFSGITVEAWVKLNAWNNNSIDPNDYGLSGLFCGDQWPEGSFQFVAVNEGYLAPGVRDSYGGGVFNDYDVWNPTLFETNKWMHLATVYDSVAKTFRLYVNGAEAALFNLDNAPPAFLGPSHLGAWMASDGLLHRFLDGQMDEVAVYGSALAAGRIAAHYDAAVSIQITQQPADAATSPGGTAMFSVAAVTPGVDLPLRYQWHRAGDPIPDATNATYTTDALALADNGARFGCTLAVGPLSRESATAYVTVISTNDAQALAVFADHPLLYYRFEEQNGGSIFDSSGHGYHGTASNVFRTAGPMASLGSAAAFHGYDNFDNPASVAVPAVINSLTSDSLFNQVTLVTWLKLNDWNFANLPGDFGRGTLFGSDFPTPGAFGLSARTFNEFSLDLAGSAGGGMLDFYPVYDGAVFVPGVWLHLAAVYDAIGKTFKLYTNGALCETVTLDFAPPARLDESHIGAWRGALGILQRRLNGQVDDLAVFGTALSAQRIAAQYQSGITIQITQQPADTWAQPGGTAMFAVAAQTVGVEVPLRFQWKRNGANIANATNATYTTPALAFSDNGAQFKCVLTAGPVLAESTVAAVTVAATNIPYAQAVLADQPLLYYRMEEQAGNTAIDSSGHGYHGKRSNASVAGGPAPWLGSAASFGGSAAPGSIAVPPLVNPATSNSFFGQMTVEAWVKLSSWNEALGGEDLGLSALFSGDGWPEGSFQFFAGNPNRVSFGVKDSSGGGFFNDYSSTDPSLFTTNVWVHLATVYDSSQQVFRLYVNGALKEAINLDYAPFAYLGSSHIGAWLGIDQGLHRFLNGQVDEVAVYATALSPQRLAAHYQTAVAIRITQQPVDVVGAPGGAASFTVTAHAQGTTVPLQYQWNLNDTPIPGATNANYAVNPLTLNSGGRYHCTLALGPFMVESAEAYLTIIDTNTPYAQAVLADGPVLYYRLEELNGRTVYDSSGHGYHGLSSNVVAGSSYQTALGLAAGFGGPVSGANIAVPALINPTTLNSSFNQLTVEAWVKLSAWNDVPDDLGLSAVFSGDMWPAGSFQLFAVNPDHFSFGVRDSSSGGAANDYPVTNAAVFTTGVWLHLATVYDAGNRTFRFYTNGVQAKVVSLDTAPPANLTDSHLGAWLGFDENLHRFLDGQIDEVAVYATALPPARIAAHYWSAIPNVVFATHEGAQLRFEWIIPSVVLQQNTNLANPSGWTDVPGATNSPFVVPFSSAQKFFRLKKY